MPDIGLVTPDEVVLRSLSSFQTRNFHGAVLAPGKSPALIKEKKNLINRFKGTLSPQYYVFY
jgi:hypothetical protein